MERSHQGWELKTQERLGRLFYPAVEWYVLLLIIQTGSLHIFISPSSSLSSSILLIFLTPLYILTSSTSLIFPISIVYVFMMKYIDSHLHTET